MNQSISQIVNALPETKNVSQLQGTLNALGIEGDLAALPAEQVSDKFRQLMAGFLTGPIDGLSKEQILALTAETKKEDNTLETTQPNKDNGNQVEKDSQVRSDLIADIQRHCNQDENELREKDTKTLQAILAWHEAFERTGISF
jgi:hypothetical protein